MSVLKFWNAATGQWEAVAGAQGPTGPISSTFSRLFVVGHSLAAGGGAPMEDIAWHSLLAGMLRAENVNWAKGGAVASWAESNTLPYGQTGDGGFGHVLADAPFPSPVRFYKGVWSAATTYKAGDVVQTGAAPYAWWVSPVDSNLNHSPTTDTGANWISVATNTNGGHPYQAEGRLPIVDYGLNDLGWGGNLNAFLNAMRVIIAAMTCAEITGRALDPRCTYTGTWTAATLGHGAAYVSSVTNGAKTVPSSITAVETIAVQGDWPGGYVTVNYAVSATTNVLTAGVFRVQVDGATVLTKDLSTDQAGGAGKVVGGAMGLRFQVPAGPHTITIQQTTAYTGGTLYTDALMFEANPAPPVIVPGLHKTLTAAAYTNTYGAGTAASDANVDAWNTALASMLANEFPTAFFFASDLADHDPTKFFLDGIHPNGHGHAIVAKDSWNEIVNVVLPSLSDEMRALLQRPLKVGRQLQLVFGPDSTASSYNIPIGAWTEMSYATSMTGYVGGATRFIEGTISADVGDVIEIALMAVWNNDAGTSVVDFEVIGFPNGTSQPGVPVNYVSGQGQVANAQAANGLPGGQGLNASAYDQVLPGTVYYVVQSGDLRNGTITLRVIVKTATTNRHVLLSAGNPVYLNLRNIGQLQWFNGEGSAR